MKNDAKSDSVFSLGNINSNFNLILKIKKKTNFLIDRNFKLKF